MSFDEHAVCFACHDSWLYGIIGLPHQPRSRGVVIMVGGPQYRAGSHRQFTLLARDLAAQGFPVMRFDYRGMGDSEGCIRNFDSVGDDLCHAIDQLFEKVPALKEVVVWGLCDGASAALLYAYQDTRVTGLILANPWIRTDEGIAKAYLKHYYRARIFEAELWLKICKGEFDYLEAGRSFTKLVCDVLLKPKKDQLAFRHAINTRSVPERMFDGFRHFQGRALLFMSGNDLTAKEFSDLVNSSRKWRKLVQSPLVQRVDLLDADHTFSRRDWHTQIVTHTKEWLQSW